MASKGIRKKTSLKTSFLHNGETHYLKVRLRRWQTAWMSVEYNQRSQQLLFFRDWLPNYLISVSLIERITAAANYELRFWFCPTFWWLRHKAINTFQACSLRKLVQWMLFTQASTGIRYRLGNLFRLCFTMTKYKADSSIRSSDVNNVYWQRIQTIQDPWSVFSYSFKRRTIQAFSAMKN